MRIRRLLFSVFFLLLAACGSSGSGVPISAPEPPPPSPPPSPQSLTLSLNGAQVVPRVVTTSTASATVTTSTSANGTTMTVHVDGAGLDRATGVHVHEGIAGTNGRSIIELLQDPAEPTRWSFEAFEVDGALFSALETSMLYVDVHTQLHPRGEIRGQIQADAAVRFIELSGGDVVPSMTSARSGIVAVTDADPYLEDWEPVFAVHVNLDSPVGVRSVTLNHAALGQNGPFVYQLDQDPTDFAHWSIDNAEFDEFEIRGFYISVETVAFPGGELRAQIDTRNTWAGSPNAFKVTSVDPDDGATVATFPQSIIAGFNADLFIDTAIPENVDVLASGGDGDFFDGDEQQLGPLTVSAAGPVLNVDLSGVMGQDDVYQLTLRSSGALYLRDTRNRRLDGAFNGTNTTSSSDFISTFAVDGNRPAPASLQEIQDRVLTPSCALSGCHSAADARSGLDLSAGQSYRNIVNVPSSEDPSLDLIEPNDPVASYLITKVDTPWWTSHTPDFPELSNSSIQLLRDWVLQGAPNN